MDSSKSIEKKEANEYWGKKLIAINTIALFKQVDVNADGRFELGE